MSDQRHSPCLRVDDVWESAAPDVVGLFSIIVEIDTRVFWALAVVERCKDN